MAIHQTTSDRTVQQTLSRVALCGGSAADSSSLLKRGLLWAAMAVAVWFMVASLFAGSAYAAERVASVEYSKGAVSAIDPNGSPRLIGRGSDIFTGDLIETASQSFAIVKFEDGTLMTLRPDTAFRVEDFKPEQGKGQALFKLLKGGFRVLTGFISKSSDGVFRVDTPVATIGVRGTEFDARLCTDARCTDGASTAAQQAAAVVAQMRGNVSIENGSRSQAAAPGSAVQTGATVKTSDASWALLIFADGSRVTVDPNTEFEISEFNYDRDQASNNSFIVRLLVGSMRALTGAIARLNPTGYRVETASANLGVRGTGFDLATTDGVAVHVWDSCVDISSATGTLPVCAGQYATQSEPDSVPSLVDQLPLSLRNMLGPRPDSEDIGTIDSDQLLGVVEPRLYVTVTEGLVDLTNEGDRVQLGADQNAMATPGGEIILIEDLPDSMINDVMPKPGEINDRLLGLFDLVQGGLSRGAGQTARVAAAVTNDSDSDSAGAGNDSDRTSASGSDGSDEVAEVRSDRSDSADTSPVDEAIPLECAVQ